MTQALCLKCGKLKHGAFDACQACGVCPVDDCDACSLALTDHYFALETLREIGRSMPERGGPSLPPEQEERLLATIRDPKLACHPDRGNDAGCNDGRRKQEGQRP
jgi:hypothetical protein